MIKEGLQVEEKRSIVYLCQTRSNNQAKGDVHRTERRGDTNMVKDEPHRGEQTYEEDMEA